MSQQNQTSCEETSTARRLRCMCDSDGHGSLSCPVHEPSAASIANCVSLELSEGRDIALTHAEASLLMAEYDRRGRVELGHE